MRSGSTQPQSGDWRPIAGIPGDRTHVEKLVQRHFAVIRITLRQPVDHFHVAIRFHKYDGHVTSELSEHLPTATTDQAHSDWYYMADTGSLILVTLIPDRKPGVSVFGIFQ
jgi:hypothetical protein